jgi:hypothetical protein
MAHSSYIDLFNNMTAIGIFSLALGFTIMNHCSQAVRFGT